MSMYSSLSSYLDTQSDMQEAKKKAEESQRKLEQQKRAMQEELRRSPMGTPQYNEIVDKIHELDASIDEQKKAVTESQDQLNELHANVFNKAADKAEAFVKPAAGDLPNVVTGLANYFATSGRPKNSVDPTGESTHLRNQAQLNEQAAGDMQKASQAESQIANRDTKTEADKKAIAQGGVKATQIQQQLGAETGAAAGLAGMQAIENADYNYEEGRADTARQHAVERTKDVYDQRQQAEENRALAGQSDYIASNEGLQRLRARQLAMGGNTVNVTHDDDSAGTSANEQKADTTAEQEATTEEQKTNGQKTTDEYEYDFNYDKQKTDNRPKATSKVTPTTPDTTGSGKTFEDPRVAGGKASTFDDKTMKQDANSGYVPDPEKSIVENLAAKGTFGESPAAWLDKNGEPITLPDEVWKDMSGADKRNKYWYWDPFENSKVWTDKKVVSIPNTQLQNMYTFDTNGKRVSDGNLKNIIKSLVDCSRF